MTPPSCPRPYWLDPSSCVHHTIIYDPAPEVKLSPDCPRKRHICGPCVGMRQYVSTSPERRYSLDSVIDFLTLVWGERHGWVDIPSKSGGHWTPFSAEWPTEKGLVERRIASCLEDDEDVYFSVAQFSERGRRLKDTQPSAWLWADLDTVDPTDCATLDLTPTVCWESSPFRYQALWRVDRRLSADVLAKVNRALSYAVGADKGGWDLTQVLRPVGTRNMKYPGGPAVIRLYQDGLKYEVSPS